MDTNIELLSKDWSEIFCFSFGNKMQLVMWKSLVRNNQPFIMGWGWELHDVVKKSYPSQITYQVCISLQVYEVVRHGDQV